MHKPIPWTVEDVLEATGGRLVSGDRSCFFEGISIDSRTLAANDLFVAIRGQKHDGHQFIENVVAAGCRGIIVEKTAVEKLSLPLDMRRNGMFVAVTDTTQALADLAAYQRRRSQAAVIGITGSNGKTSTKELTMAVFGQKFPSLATAGNFNNEIGLPLTLLRLGYHHQWAVLELGMNHPGEIRALARICSPDIGIITNVGTAHLEGVGSIEGVMQAKGELLGEIKRSGVAVLNSDDPRVRQLAGRAHSSVLLYGTGDEADVQGRDVRQEGLGYSFSLMLPDGESTDIHLASPGRFMVSNALAAATAGYAAGIDAGTIRKGLENCKPVKGRLGLLRSTKGFNIIDDTYNANPDSMKQAIATLAALKKDRRAFLALGDMYELGTQAAELHKTVGEFAARSGIDRLYVIGNFAEYVVQGALEAGMAAGRIRSGDPESLIEEMRRELQQDEWVLVKGSRAMKMETVVQGLMAS
ncbi:MAG: UDP-N-acetylmuramoyl-tripeptide--D-alanyl-D-alanine ligase [Thermodesulfobacteriota bacterium]